MSSESFWQTADDRHKEIARTFYENIERTSPKYVTSRRMCPCLEYSNRCIHPLDGEVAYFKYNGPNIQRI